MKTAACVIWKIITFFFDVVYLAAGIVAMSWGLAMLFFYLGWI